MTAGRLLGNLGLTLVLLTSALIGVYAFLFQAGVAGSPEFHARFETRYVFASMHVLGSGVALLLGGMQFLTRLRTRVPALHRRLGQLYLLMILVGGIGGLGLAPVAQGGLVARVGFASLALLWLVSAGRAWFAIRAGDVVLHRHWMLRNFAMTFAAVTLRLHLGLLQLAGFSFDEAYPLVAWLAWVPNLLLVEWWLGWRGHRDTLRAST